MRCTTLVCALSLFGTSLLGASAVAAGPNDKGKGHDSIRVHMKGFEEAPVVVSGASGVLELDIDEAAGSIAYELSYEGLEGNVTQAHIHIGQKNVSGGIALWLCQTPAAPAPASPPANPAVAATPQCPGPRSGTVAGTLTSANVVGPVGQAVPVGAFADVVTAIRVGKAYGNVHTTAAPGGEVRGQLH
jgi:hypothetical protein